MLPTFNLSSPNQLYDDLVSATHAFYKLYVSQPDIQARRAALTCLALDASIQDAKEDAERDGIKYIKLWKAESVRRNKIKRRGRIVKEFPQRKRTLDKQINMSGKKETLYLNLHIKTKGGKGEQERGKEKVKKYMLFETVHENLM